MHALTATLLSLFLLGPFAPGWLGVYLDEDAERAVVTEVIPDSPAAKAGIEAGDVMLAVGDQATPTREAFIAAIRGADAGAKVRIKLRRGKQEKVLEVRLGERAEAGAIEVPQRVARPSRNAPPEPPAPATEVVPAERPAGQGFLGLSVVEGDDGVRIDRVLPNSPAAEAGLRAGETLRSIGDAKVRSLADLDRVLQRMGPGDKVAVAVAGESGARSVMVEIGVRPGQARREALSRPAPSVTTIDEPEEAMTRPARPARTERAERAERSARPERPARTERPARPERPAAPADAPAVPAPGRDADQDDLRRELQELRRELAELRRMLERLKKDGRE